MDNDTMEVVKLHPLFDHNNAFDTEWMIDNDAQYMVTGKSIRDSAKYAMNKVDFHFTSDITNDKFVTKRQYDSFRKRASELGIKTVKDNPFLSAASTMAN